MIKPKCDRCQKELTTFGGLAFSPPEVLPAGTPCREVNKHHICVECWKQFMLWVTPPVPTTDRNWKLSYEFAHELLALPNMRVVVAVPVFDMPGAATAMTPFPITMEVEGTPCIQIGAK